MEILQEIEKAKEHFRKGYAILGAIEAHLAPNVREEVRHHENLALLADHPKPGPLLPLEPEIRKPEPPEQDE